MLLDPVARGRFERSEPTIVDGQDLDVPTFLRRNVKVK
jgi:cell division protein FtsZ